MTTAPNSRDGNGIRRQLYELVDDDGLSLVEKQRAVLSVVREYLGVTNGHLQCHHADTVDEVVVSVGDDPELFPEGAVIDRTRPYRRRTVEAHSPVALSKIPRQGWHEESNAEGHGFECYLGTTVFVGGEVYGTVCFVSETPREDVFTPDEKAIVELVARLLGRAIDSYRHDQHSETGSRAEEPSRRKYEALLELAPKAVFVVGDDTGLVETANGRAADLIGATESELRGRSILELFPAEQRTQYRQLFDGELDDGIRERFDDGTPLEVRRSDGTEVPVELGLSRVELDDRTVVLTILRDVSARRERERELERSQTFLQQTQAAVDLGGWEIDLDTRTGRWTDEVYRIFGQSPDDELTVEDAVGYIHPDDRQKLTDAFERLRRGGEVYDLELRIRTDDGGVRWVRTVGKPQYDTADGETEDDGDTQPSRAVGIIREISDRKRREQDLRLKNQAIEETTVGITIADATEPRLPIVYANSGFEDLTGYSKEKVMGRNCRFLQGAGTNDRTTAEIRRAVEAGEPIQAELLNYRANGTPFWNELTISPIMGAGSRETTHFVGIQRDVTAQKRRERLIEVLDRVLRHNLRNDMNVVLGYSDVIARRADGELSHMAGQINDVATGLIALSNKVRNFETGITELDELDRRDLRQDVRSVVGTLRTEFPDTEFHVDATCEGTVLATEQLKQALSELGENAAKHGASAVYYEVTTTDDGRTAVHVHDDGPGLPMAERTVLESGQETPLEHGSGLGLWMVNRIVTNLGGDVTATVDDGTTVTITLQSEPEGGVEHPSGTPWNE